MNELTATLIIPTYKPGEKFRKLLRMIAEQTVLPERILILNTEEIYFKEEDLKLCPGTEVHHIAKSSFDHGGTRDWGARMADTDLLLFMTMDAVPADDHLIENLKAAFADPQVAAAYGCQLPNSDCSMLERYTRQFNYGEVSRVKSKEDLECLGIKTFFCSNVCSAYRSSAYRKYGGFEKRTIFNEDMIFAGKLILSGCSIAYCADAKVYHSHNYSGMEQLRRNFDLGVSQADHPEIFQMAKSESEGVRMVKSTAVWLIKQGKPWLLFSLIWQSGCKYLGYRMGKAYRRLPGWMISYCTMNPGYWKKTEGQ